ncbi:MAG: hypothetical protein K2N16_04930 [Muribaculaceae bacterium]|nr:hypothetical protein [Muribaculaceae bacterium]
MALNLSCEEYLRAYTQSMDSLDITITYPTDFERYASPDELTFPIEKHKFVPGIIK